MTSVTAARAADSSTMVLFAALHTDIWTGTAADLASKGAIAVYPVAGWWKNRRDYDQSEQGVDYSLVVSIESPEVEVDLWTPVAQEVRTTVEITT